MKRKGGAYGFTLAEMLAVVAIMVVLMSLTLPLVANLRQGARLTQAVRDLAVLLEQAQLHASANNTYVWAGFHYDAAAANGPVLTMALVESVTGGAVALGGTGSYQWVGNAHRFEHVRIEPDLTVTGMQPDGDPVEDSTLGTFTRKMAGVDVTFSSLIRFEPTGGARIKSDLSRVIDIGLQPFNGQVADADNIAVVQVAGLTGKVEVFRP